MDFRTGHRRRVRCCAPVRRLSGLIETHRALPAACLLVNRVSTQTKRWRYHFQSNRLA